MDIPKESGEAGVRAGSIHVVVVDPDAQSRFWLGTLLSQGYGVRGATIVECTGSADALAAVRAGPPCDLLIAELDLAQGDGIELLRALARTGYEGAIMLVSGCDPRTLAAAGRLARALGLRLLCTAAKPLLPAKVRKALSSCIASSFPKAVRSWSAEELAHAFTLRQFDNFYQPQVELGSGRVMGFELLVRWAHPGFGVLAAEDFIHEIEANGRTDELLLATLPRALRDVGSWQRRGQSFSLAINVSPLTLRNVAFPDLLEAEAAAAGFPLDQIIVEVTEGRPLDDPRTQFDTLLRLRLKGVSLSMDDFGKGHASIDNLRSLPFQEIKLDRGLVQGARRDPSLRTIMEASLCTAKRLGLRVVAEGLETHADLEFVRTYACHGLQGNLLGLPMPASGIRQWLGDRPDVASGFYRVAASRARGFVLRME